MTDINRMNGLKDIQNVRNVQSNKVEDSKVQKDAGEKVVSNLTGPAAMVGRSQVKKADNLNEDINFLLNNPQAIKKAEAFFNMAYEKLLKEDSPNAYEKAAAMATAYAREMAANKKA